MIGYWREWTARPPADSHSGKVHSIEQVLCCAVELSQGLSPLIQRFRPLCRWYVCPSLCPVSVSMRVRDYLPLSRLFSTVFLFLQSSLFASSNLPFSLFPFSFLLFIPLGLVLLLFSYLSLSSQVYFVLFFCFQDASSLETSCLYRNILTHFLSNKLCNDWPDICDLFQLSWWYTLL